MIKTVFCDLDDVLADFMGGLHKALDIPYDYSNYPYKKGDWNILGYQIKSNDELVTFEQCNDYCDYDFWQNLEWMHDGYDILTAVEYEFAPAQIYLLTTPMPNLESASGKMMWIRKNLPMYKDRIFIATANKSVIARPDTLLIDDRDENVEGFAAAGGYGILINRPWNKGHERAGHTVSDLELDLLDIKDI